MNLGQLFLQGDAISRSVALLLLLMSVASWVVIFWKASLLWRAVGDVSRSVAAFWQAASMDEAQHKVAAFDRATLVLPLLTATQNPALGTLAAAGERTQQLTRVLRDALNAGLHQLQYGQVLLATVGSTAPFVGLLGTVWGIYHALTGIAGGGQISIDKIAGPVGEALIMTAIGLAVAVPAVLGYNWLVRRNKAVMDEVRGFAADLHAVLLAQASAKSSPASPSKG